MTKARDTANLVATGVPNSLITLDAAEIPNISTDKLTSGTLANARVADLPTSKITSGTFADARISESSVTAHVTATDLTPVRQDVLTLALKQAIQENSTKFNLPNAAVCKFEADADFDLAGSTTIARHSDEYIYVSSGSTGTALGKTNVPTSAVTDVSGVFLIKHASGANTLGTDVKAYFTCDNSNWTETDAYADAGTFSTGIKMIKLDQVTCTSGSDVRWKITFANQSGGSKVAYIYGISLNY